MTAAASLQLSSRRRNAQDEAVSISAGILFTAALVFAMAHVASVAPETPPAWDEGPQLMALPLDLPPPPPILAEQAPPSEPTSNVVGLDIGASDSPVRIAVTPPDLDAIVRAHDEMPKAQLDIGRLYSDFRPKAGPVQDLQHVYQTSEVDEKPTRQITTVPIVPSRVRGNAETLSVRLIILVNEVGRPTSVRVSRSSGNPQFDAIIVRCVQEEWGFTAAVRKGKRVKCLTEQLFTVRWSSGSPFRI